jgi:hypothetical protein
MRHAIALIAIMPGALAAGSEQEPRLNVGGWLRAQRQGPPLAAHRSMAGLTVQIHPHKEWKSKRSRSCQLRPLGRRGDAHLFDHLVGAEQNRLRNGDP